MSESTPFSIGVWKDGKTEKSHIDAEYLIEKEFTAIDELRYSKEIEPGKLLIYDLSTREILVKKGEADPIVVSEYSRSTQFLEGFWKTTTGFNL